MAKVLVLTRYADECLRLLETAELPALDGLAVTKNAAEALALGNDFDIVFGEPILVRNVLAALPDLRWVHSIWAGVEPLLDPSLRRDYVLTNTRGVFSGLISEFVFGYLFFHERQILQRFQAQQEKRWDRSKAGSLHGKTIGLLGVGSIGAHLAQTAKHFGMTVRGYTRSSESCRAVDAYYHGDALPDFATGLDYLVSVLPNTPATRQIVGASLLGRLPAHAVFLNVGRGAAVDESALISALDQNRLAMAVLDVFEQEPLPPDHPFWQTPNLFMTFHTAALSTPADLTRVFVENYHRYINGQPLLHLVDFERGY